ncbi:MAG: hypothetical protein IJT59_05165, partial [Desulfovibrionaceae bacterium]|nr:hypothetical protein [Desulfovibrionaceae bacterium]
MHYYVFPEIELNERTHSAVFQKSGGNVIELAGTLCASNVSNKNPSQNAGDFCLKGLHTKICLSNADYESGRGEQGSA